MTARTGLADIITVLRGLTQAGTADFAIGTTSYFNDDQLQIVLDRHRMDIDRELLQPVPGVLGGGTLEYKNYYSQFKNLESGTAIFNLENANGTDYGTALWTADYLNGRVAFGSDTAGSSVFLIGRAYDLNAAAADVWTQKSGAAATMYDFSTDNHSLKRSQYYDHCIKQAAYFSGMSWSNGQSIDLDRSDTHAYR